MCDNEYFHGTGVTQAYFQINKFVMYVYTHRVFKKTKQTTDSSNKKNPSRWHASLEETCSRQSCLFEREERKEEWMNEEVKNREKRRGKRHNKKTVR